jgi:transposase
MSFEIIKESIFKKKIRGKWVYFVQLILEGIPLVKEKNKTPIENIGKTVAFDLGPQSIAIVSETGHSELNVLLPEINRTNKKIIKTQRKMSKLIRENNPHLFEPTTIKKKKTKNKDGSRKKNIKTKFRKNMVK